MHKTTDQIMQQAKKRLTITPDHSPQKNYKRIMGTVINKRISEYIKLTNNSLYKI